MTVLQWNQVVSEIAFTKVKLPFGWLGNMAPFPIEHRGQTWRTSEALFQAMRFEENDPAREQILNEASPMSGKMIAKKYRERMVVKPRSTADLANMRAVLELKHAQHEHVRKALQGTVGLKIYEDCTARQNDSGLFWGAARSLNDPSRWMGENHLGRLWMEIRDHAQPTLF